MADKNESRTDRFALDDAALAQVTGGDYVSKTRDPFGDTICSKSPTGRHVFIQIEGTYEDGYTYVRTACKYCDRNAY